MVIKFYGTRGSIAVASKDTKKYGGNTTCLYIESNSGDAIIVDAGTGIRELGTHLVQNNKDEIHLIFTHYHWDHIQGFPFFAPVYLNNKTIFIYGNKKETTVKKALAYQMVMPYFPASFPVDTRAKITFKELKDNIKIGNVLINTIPNNHPNYTTGLKFTEGKKSFAFLTDNEIFVKKGNTPYKKFVEFTKGVDFFIHDAQYNDEIYPSKLGWGHSTYTQVMRLAKDAGVKNVIFTHHDHGSSDKFIDNNIRDMRSKYPNYYIQAAADGKTIILK
jgi:phosphoribosyl 1,2-cyclic phosphodiesterase